MGAAHTGVVRKESARPGGERPGNDGPGTRRGEDPGDPPVVVGLAQGIAGGRGGLRREEGPGREEGIGPGSAASLAVSLATGLAVGVATVLGETYLGGPAGVLIGSVSVWLTPAWFLAATRVRRAGAITAATTCLVASLIGYHAAQAAVNHLAVDPADPLVWLWFGAALIAGPLFGTAGHAWRHGTGGVSERHGAGVAHILATCLLPAAFLSEAAITLVHLVPRSVEATIPAGIAVAIGLGLYAGLLGRRALRPPALLALAATLAAGLAGFEILYQVMS